MEELDRREVTTFNGKKAVIVVEEHTGPLGPRISESEYYESMEEEHHVMSHSLPSVATLCNSAIGAGVLSLPFAFRNTGALGGVLLCLSIGAAEAFTLYVLSKMSERYNASSYSQLIRATLGKKMATFLALIMIVYMWGACNAYLVIVGDVFSSLGGYLAGPDSMLADRQIIIVSIGAVFLLPLCFIKRIGALSALSSVAVVGFLYTAAVVLRNAFQIMSKRQEEGLSRWDGVQLINVDLRALFALPIVVFGFNCHANAVPIFQELTEEPENLLPIKSRRKTSKLVNMIAVILATISLIMAGYLVVGLAGYVAYPTSVTSNVLNILPESDPWVQAARGFIGVVVAGHFPLNHHPARAGALDFAAMAGIGQATRESFVAPLFTSVFVLSSVAVSCFVTDLGDVIHLIGGTVAALLIFFNPGFMLINAAIVKDSTKKLSQLSLMQDQGDDEDEVTSSLNIPILMQAASKGIKKTGLVYSPGKSWAAGLVLVTFAVFIFIITMITTFLH